MTAPYKPLCDRCNVPIPKERLKALPSTTVCVKCSSEVRKTAADVDIALADGEQPMVGNGDGNSLGRAM